MKAKRAISLFVFLIIIFVLFFIIDLKKNELTPPQRHQSIPKDAVWAGGVDGGFWFKVIELKKNNVLRIIIYHDFTGEIEIDSYFILKPNRSFDYFKNKDIYKLISHFNGNDIVLKFKDKDLFYLTPIIQSNNKNTYN